MELILTSGAHDGSRTRSPRRVACGQPRRCCVLGARLREGVARAQWAILHMPKAKEMRLGAPRPGSSKAILPFTANRPSVTASSCGSFGSLSDPPQLSSLPSDCFHRGVVWWFGVQPGGDMCRTPLGLVRVMDGDGVGWSGLSGRWDHVGPRT